MRTLPLLALFLATSTLPGCLLLLGNADPSCPNEPVLSSGTLTVDGAERSPVIDSLNLDADPTGSCIHAVSLSLDLGQGCSIHIDADGPMDAMAVYDVTVFDDEACGLPDTGFRLQDAGDSTVSLDGNLFSVGGDDSVCYDGTVEVDLSLVLEEDGVLATIEGSVVGEGIEIAWFDAGNCD